MTGISTQRRVTDRHSRLVGQVQRALIPRSSAVRTLAGPRCRGGLRKTRPVVGRDRLGHMADHRNRPARKPSAARTGCRSTARSYRRISCGSSPGGRDTAAEKRSWSVVGRWPVVGGRWTVDRDAVRTKYVADQMSARASGGCEPGDRRCTNHRARRSIVAGKRAHQVPRPLPARQSGQKRRSPANR
jgi:hypothetical protein